MAKNLLGADLAGEELARAFYGRASLDEVIATTVQRTTPFFRPPARSR